MPKTAELSTLSGFSGFGFRVKGPKTLNLTSSEVRAFMISKFRVTGLGVQGLGFGVERFRATSRFGDTGGSNGKNIGDLFPNKNPCLDSLV